MLLHVVDASGTSGRDPVADLETVLQEVREQDGALLARPQLLAATKRDAVGGVDPLPELQVRAAALGFAVVPVSAVSGRGLVELKRALVALLPRAEAPALAARDTA